jgi:hypothetical protein
MSNENNYEQAAGDLENREFNQEVISQETIKPTSLGKAGGFENDRDSEPALLPGYHEIWSDNFPSKGLFYQTGARFFIRAASVKEIRHFSTINEQDPFSVDEALNEIVKSCLMTRFPGKQASYKDLREEDRIHIILTIRDLTFSTGENRLALNVTCRDCNHENEIEIKNDSFETNILSDTIMKYYDDERKIFVVNTKSSGVIELVPPSIGVMGEVTKLIRRTQEQDGRKLDASFIKSLPYMVQDWRGLNESRIQNLEIEFMQWDTTRYNTFSGLTEMCKVGVKDQLRRECEKCGSEVRTQISFPNGIKSLFVVSDITGELL